MRKGNPLALIGLLCGAAVVGLAMWLMQRDPPNASTKKPDSAGAKAATEPPGIYTDSRRFGPITDGGLGIAVSYTGLIRDPHSLQELRAALQARGREGLSRLRSELERLWPLRQLPGGDAFSDAHFLQLKYAMLLMYDGRWNEAADTLEDLLKIIQSVKMSPALAIELKATLGVISLRRGEVDNCIACLGPSSCIFPIAPEAVHTNPAGSREAIKQFTACLEEVPGDLRIRWLLNLAYMTLGEYPDRVPPEHLIPLDAFRSKMDVGRFHNVAPLIGLTSRGPNLAGGSIFDDFTGDGLPDVFTTDVDADQGASLYVNRGDGSFEDRSEAAGLNDQIYALNVARADFNNDGNLDVLLLRGAWENPMRMSLLRNKGNGTFEDVTVAAGLGEPIATESVAWGDYDNDGFVDLFVCGEYLPCWPKANPPTPDPRNRCRLYHNRGNGTFVDVAVAAGVGNEQCAKGSAWGDYDGDGWLDLYVSNRNGASRLYHNEKNGTFRDLAAELRVTGPNASFACWFWDYDNDGRLDLYVNDFAIALAEFTAFVLGLPTQQSSSPRLYRNLGPDGFRDVTAEVGLDRPIMAMGCNFGDIDNDGYLDLYFGTGFMSIETLIPNLMLKNVAGGRFEDVTMSSGTGHLQKGHGVSFADWDCDGDLDLFLEAGGAIPGDKAYNLLFQNPGHGRHWLKVKLIGTKTNRAALGARIRAVVKGTDGATRSIYRTVGNNSSFGGNSLVELLGLLDATRVAELEISWPTSRTTQTFRDIAADQAIEITEGADAYKTLPHKRLPAPPKLPVSPKRA